METPVEFVRSTRDRDYVVILGVSAVLFAALLLLANPVGAGVAGLFCALSLWNYFAYAKAYVCLEAEFLTWDFRGFRRGHGRVGIAEVTSAVVDDCSCRIIMKMRDGSKREVPYSARGLDVWTAFSQMYPTIPTRFVESP